MTTADDEIVGPIGFFPITHYLVGYEISYQLFGDQHAGCGYTSEAVKLLVRYLFGLKRVDRLQLIHPDNAASRRMAERCGFTFEGVMRAAWFHGGVYRDLEIWSLLRDDVTRPREIRRIAATGTARRWWCARGTSSSSRSVPSSSVSS